MKLESILYLCGVLYGFGGDYDDAWNEYMIYGGLPQVVQFSVERQKAEYLKNIFTNVYIKDVVERNKIHNVDEINTLIDILASAIGAPTNPTKYQILLKVIEASFTIIKRYQTILIIWQKHF